MGGRSCRSSQAISRSVDSVWKKLLLRHQDSPRRLEQNEMMSQITKEGGWCQQDHGVVSKGESIIQAAGQELHKQSGRLPNISDWRALRRHSWDLRFLAVSTAQL